LPLIFLFYLGRAARGIKHPVGGEKKKQRGGGAARFKRETAAAGVSWFVDYVRGFRIP